MDSLGRLGRQSEAEAWEAFLYNRLGLAACTHALPALHCLAASLPPRLPSSSLSSLSIIGLEKEKALPWPYV